jgi:hypothetical protein
MSENNTNRQWNCLDPWPPQPEKDHNKTTIEDIMAKAKAFFPKKANPLFEEDPTEKQPEYYLPKRKSGVFGEMTTDFPIDEGLKSQLKTRAENESMLAQTVANLENSKKVIDLHSTMDAQIWTDEFLKTFQYANLDRDSVLAWVSNMIMVGYDHANHRRDKDYTYILKSQTGIVDVFWYEPTVKQMDQAYAKYLNQEILEPGASEWNCVLYRWSKNTGLEVWNGKAQVETRYNWKRTQTDDCL